MNRSKSSFRLWTFLLCLWAGCGALAQGNPYDPMDPANPRPPRNLSESMGRDVRALGNSYAEYQRLRQEGAANVARLERALQACGNCADRARLQAELTQARSAENMVRRAEADTLQGMGLGQYDTVQELVRANVLALGGTYDFGTEHTRERIRRILGDHCRNGQIGTLDVSKLVACISNLNGEQQLVLFKTALTWCQQRAGDNFVNLCRSGEACDAFEGCMRANSGAVAICTDNVARGISQDRPQRCFSYLLHPGLFGGGTAPSALPAGPPLQRATAAPNPVRDARLEEGRQRTCENLARQMERQRDDLARRPMPSKQRMLERNEAAFETHRCGTN